MPHQEAMTQLSRPRRRLLLLLHRFNLMMRTLLNHKILVGEWSGVIAMQYVICKLLKSCRNAGNFHFLVEMIIF